MDYYRERVEDAEDDGWGDRASFTPVPPRYSRDRKHHPPKKKQAPPTPLRQQPMVSEEPADQVNIDQSRQDYNKGKVYSQDKRGISSILPHESTHPKARLRVLQDCIGITMSFQTRILQ